MNLIQAVKLFLVPAAFVNRCNLCSFIMALGVAFGAYQTTLTIHQMTRVKICMDGVSYCVEGTGVLEHACLSYHLLMIT